MPTDEKTVYFPPPPRDPPPPPPDPSKCVTIRPAAAYDIEFPDGTVVTMHQEGEPWEGMVVFYGMNGERLVVDYGYFNDLTDVFGDILGRGKKEGRVRRVIKACPQLLEHMQRRKPAPAPAD